MLAIAVLGIQADCPSWTHQAHRFAVSGCRSCQHRKPGGGRAQVFSRKLFDNALFGCSVPSMKLKSMVLAADYRSCPSEWETVQIGLAEADKRGIKRSFIFRRAVLDWLTKEGLLKVKKL